MTQLSVQYLTNESGCRDSRRQRFRPRARPGAVLALVALSLVGLVGVAALAIDIGMLYSARAEAQRTADAAALAGASSFLDFDPVIQPVAAQDTARRRAYDYAKRQSIMGRMVDTVEVQPQIMLATQRVRVVVQRTAIPLFFARVFGLQIGTVTAAATAEATNAGTSTCVKPFAIPDLWAPATPQEDIYKRGASDPPIWDFDAHLNPDLLPAGSCPVGNNGRPDCAPEVWTPPTTYDRNATGYNSTTRDGFYDYRGNKYLQDRGRRVPLKMNSPGMTNTPGWFFPWRLDGSSGGDDYRDALAGCWQGVSVGQTVQTEPGNMIGPTDQGLQDLLNLDRGARWTETPDANGNMVGGITGSSFGPGGNGEGSPRIITIALINPTDVSNGMTSMRFVNFAEFFLEDPAVVYPHLNGGGANAPPITGRLIGYARGVQGPNEGTLIKRLRLIE